MKTIRAEPTYSLYVHITPNHKYYVGVTSQKVDNRWQHDGVGYKKQKLFYRAIQKYGWNNIQHIVLLDNLTKEVACECEKYLIAKYDTTNPVNGYNNTFGGEGVNGYKLTLEQIETRRRNSTGRKHTAEACKRISEKQKGKIVSDETRRKLSESHKGKAPSNKGISMSDEQRQKLSLAKIGKPGTHTQPHTEEAKRKMSEKRKGKVVSKETREKLRQKALEQWKRQKQLKEEKEN